MLPSTTITFTLYSRILRLIGLIIMGACLWHAASLAALSDATLSLIGAGVGAAILGVRYHRTLDGHARRLTTTSGWAFIQFHRHQDISAWDAIAIGPQERRSSGRHSYDAYPVRGTGAGATCELESFDDAFAARAFALSIAHATGLPIRDHLGEHARLVTTRQFAGPVSGAVTIDPSALIPPRGTRLRLDPAKRGVAIRIPPMRNLASHLGCNGALVVFIAIVWAFPRHGHHTTREYYILLYGLGAVFVIGALIARWWEGIFGQTITIDPDSGLHFRGGSIFPENILSLEIAAKNHIRALRILTHRNEYHIALGQSPEDLRYIRALILHVLRMIGCFQGTWKPATTNLRPSPAPTAATADTAPPNPPR